VRVPIRLAAAVLGSAAALGAAIAASPSAPAADGLHVSAEPGLVPAFDPAVHDYVSRCGKTGRLDLTVTSPGGGRARVDGRPARSGTLHETVTLGPSQATRVAATSPSGETATYHVRCLPRAFPQFKAIRRGSTQAQWYLVGPVGHYAVFFSSSGAPVWWKRSHDPPFNPTLLADGRIAWYPIPPHTLFGLRPDIRYELRGLDGKLDRRIGTTGVPTDFHEIQELPNGHFLLDAYRPRDNVDLRKVRYTGGPKRARVYFGEIQEVTRTGKLVWRWNSRRHIGLLEADPWWPRLVDAQKKIPRKKRKYDAVHINAISPDPLGPGPDDDGLVISSRHTNALYRIDRKTGDIDWKLGGLPTKRSLKVIGDRYSGESEFGGQHDVRVLPDGTITVYDNGRGEHRPRVVRFRIDREERTATMLESIGDRDAKLSLWQGGTRRLPGGNWTTSWASEPFVTEMTPAGKRVFKLSFRDLTSYRAVPLPFGRLGAAELRAAMDSMHPRRRAGG
jgi:Arylsulfotransferase (ASST)